jgi:hypothetical protein
MNIYFDTTIYDFIVRKQEEIAVRQFLDHNGLRVRVSSDNIYEMLATPKPDHQLAQIAAVVIIADHYEDRPASWQHAEEVRAEIARCQPGWLRYAPSKKLLRKAERFLVEHRNLWHKIKSLQLPSPGAVTIYERDARTGREHVMNFQNQMKEFVRSKEARFTSYNGTTPIAQHRKLTAEEFWRDDCMHVWFNALVKKERASRDYADWLSPYLKDEAFLRDSYFTFWLEDVDPARVPKNHVVALTSYYQMHYKLSFGNAGDQIHATHLLDVDLFITADKRFHWILDKIVTNHYPEKQRPILISREESSAVEALRVAILKR